MARSFIVKTKGKQFLIQKIKVLEKPDLVEISLLTAKTEAMRFSNENVIIQ